MTSSQQQAPQEPNVAPEDEQRDERPQAFSVLVEAVASLARQSARPPTASEVRLEMKRLTYGGFDPKALGYSRFRDFLADAEAQRLVSIDSSRQGDISVHLEPGRTGDAATSPIIRRDIWKAFVDWSPRLIRFYDLKNGRAISIPAEPALLEPIRFREIRRRLEAQPDDFIKIEPLPVQLQLQWMKEFAEQAADPDLRAVLLVALGSDKPIKAFSTVLKSVPGQASRWKTRLHHRARERIEAWRDAAKTDVPIDIYRPNEEPSVSSPQNAEPPDASASQQQASPQFNFQIGVPAPLNFGQMWTTAISIPTPRDNVAVLRARLHAAIDKMPLEELRALRIPVGYLFED